MPAFDDISAIAKRDTMALQSALAKVRDAPFLLDAIRASDALTDAAGHDGGPHAVKVLAAAIDEPDDQLIAIAAVHALGRGVRRRRRCSVVRSAVRPPALPAGTRRLGARVADPAAGRRRPVGRRRRRAAGSPPSSTSARCAAGRRPRPTTSRWRWRARCSPWTTRPGGPGWWRRWAWCPARWPPASLHRVATDDREPLRSRLAAVAALGDRDDAGRRRNCSGSLAQTDGELAGVARLAAFDLRAAICTAADPAPTIQGAGSARVPPVGAEPDDQTGLTVAQLFLHADLDRELSRAGAGDNGGIATMLVRLGDALAAEPGVSRVLTMSRGSVDAAVDALTDPATGHVLAPIPLMSEPTDAANAWPLSVAAERGIRRALTAHGRVDVVHLRMADVGSMAAAAVATRAGHPDGVHPRAGPARRDPRAGHDRCPHPGDLRDRRRAGALLVPHRAGAPARGRRPPLRAVPAAEAARPAARPAGRRHRPGTGPLHGGAGGHRPVGDDRAAQRRASGSRPTVLPASGSAPDHRPADTRRWHASRAGRPRVLVAALPAHRRGLPIALSVGRLHRVKGMATVVEAWAADPALRDRCNLLIVGGDLDHPSADEQGQLDFHRRACWPTTPMRQRV